MKPKLLLSVLSFLLGAATFLMAAEPVFSGPQKGDKITPFKVLELTGQNAGVERDPVAEDAGQPTALLFVHGIERSLVPLLRVVDEYGVERKSQLKTEIIFLSRDQIEGEQRVKAAAGSLKLQSRVGLSVDGIEGPGNYGLNRDCLITLVVAANNVVTANFALTQPGIADAPQVLEELAKACGDTNPPNVEELNTRRTARDGGGRNGGTPRRDGAGMGRERSATDLAKFDLNSEAGLRDAVRALISEVQSLRAELAAQRGVSAVPAPNAAPSDKPKDKFPGAVPDDGKLQGLLRSFIRPTNDNATVDNVLAEVKEYIKGNADLQKQAIDGWTRVLHFGDQYGTEYSRKVGREFLDELKRECN